MQKRIRKGRRREKIMTTENDTVGIKIKQFLKLNKIKCILFNIQCSLCTK